MRRNEYGNWVVNYPVACFIVVTFIIGLSTEFGALVGLLHHWLMP